MMYQLLVQKVDDRWRGFTSISTPQSDTGNGLCKVKLLLKLMRKYCNTVKIFEELRLLHRFCRQNLRIYFSNYVVTYFGPKIVAMLWKFVAIDTSVIRLTCEWCNQRCVWQHRVMEVVSLQNTAETRRPSKSHLSDADIDPVTPLPLCHTNTSNVLEIMR